MKRNGFTLVEVLIIVVFFVFALAIIIPNIVKNGGSCFDEVVSYGYNEADVKVFLRSTDYYCSDIKNSQAVRKQLDKFVDSGEVAQKKRKNTTVVMPMYVPMSH